MTAWKILLAEDDADDQKLFFDFLAHRTDFQLLPVVENGVELMETLEATTNENLPHIIILDQNMPKSNGLQTLTLLKDNERYVHLPVVIYSTYTDEQLINNSKNAGASMVVAKPVTRKGYEEMIDSILKLVQ